MQGCQRIGGKHTTITGAIVDGLARLIAEDDKGKRSPFTAIVLSDGQLAGVEFEGPPSPFYAAPDPKAESACATPPPSNPVAEALANGETATLYGIHFDVDSDVLRADAEPALQQLLEALRGAPTRATNITGHTDSDGSDSHNQDLSERRAKSVVAWLVTRGIEAKPGQKPAPRVEHPAGGRSGRTRRGGWARGPAAGPPRGGDHPGAGGSAVRAGPQPAGRVGPFPADGRQPGGRRRGLGVLDGTFPYTHIRQGHLRCTFQPSV